MKIKEKLLSKHFILSLGIILGVVFWDIFTKIITDGFEITVIKNVLSFYSTQNTGGAWSILSSATWLLTVFSCLAVVGIVVFDFVFFKKQTKLYTVAYALILGGAIGNLIDRIFLGYVRDFIRLDFIKFPIFNLADMCLVAGVICMCVFIIFIYPKLDKKSGSEKVEDNNNAR